MDRKRYNEAFDVRSFENDCFLNCSLFSMISIGFQKTGFLEISEKFLAGNLFFKKLPGYGYSDSVIFLFSAAGHRPTGCLAPPGQGKQLREILARILGCFERRTQDPKGTHSKASRIGLPGNKKIYVLFV